MEKEVLESKFREVLYALRSSKTFFRSTVSMQCIEEAVKKIRVQREMKPGDMANLSYYR
jgi:hypothetical protein